MNKIKGFLMNEEDKKNDDKSIIGGDPSDQWSFPAGGISQSDIDEILNYPIPPNNHEFDEKEFKQVLAKSVSLTKKEKIKIINSLPKLSTFQVKELIRILKEEREKFQELEEKHKKELEKFEKNREEGQEKKLNMEREEENKKKEDRQKEEELRKKLGL